MAKEHYSLWFLHLCFHKLINAVFRLERATEVLELTYLDKYFACVNANWYPGKHRSRQYQVKVRFTLRAGMVKVGNQGLDDRYIRLRSHRISHPVVSGLRQSHSITFLRPGFRPGFHVWFRSTKKLWQKKNTQIITNATNPKGEVNTIV